MQATATGRHSQAEPAFVKGMTLDQYMAQAKGKHQPREEETDQEESQNLYESSKQGGEGQLLPKSSEYCIQQIDEESGEDSVDYKRSRERTPVATPKLTRDTLEQSNPIPYQNANSLTLKKGLFKSTSKEKSQFRIKQMAASPNKKRQQAESPLSGSITLYGHKFRQTIFGGKSSLETPQLLTFYGKMGEARDQARNMRKSGRSKAPKGNFKKKNRLELEELQACESRIRQTYGGVTGVGMRVEGLRTDRCNKYC